MLISQRTLSRRSAPVVAGLAMAATLLSACAGADSKTTGPAVASVPGRAPSTAPSSSAEAGGTAPVVDRQLRLGQTQAEIDRAYAAYYACWTAAGVPSTTLGGRDGGPLLTWKLHQKKYQAAVDSCADREPLNPPELSPATNPQYWDQLRAELRCVRAKGLPFKIVPGQPGLWMEENTAANRNKIKSKTGRKDYNDCETSSFAK